MKTEQLRRRQSESRSAVLWTGECGDSVCSDLNCKIVFLVSLFDHVESTMEKLEDGRVEVQRRV